MRNSSAAQQRVGEYPDQFLVFEFPEVGIVRFGP